MIAPCKAHGMRYIANKVVRYVSRSSPLRIAHRIPTQLWRLFVEDVAMAPDKQQYILARLFHGLLAQLYNGSHLSCGPLTCIGPIVKRSVYRSTCLSDSMMRLQFLYWNFVTTETHRLVRVAVYIHPALWAGNPARSDRLRLRLGQARPILNWNNFIPWVIWYSSTTSEYYNRLPCYRRVCQQGVNILIKGFTPIRRQATISTTKALVEHSSRNHRHSADIIFECILKFH